MRLVSNGHHTFLDIYRKEFALYVGQLTYGGHLHCMCSSICGATEHMGGTYIVCVAVYVGQLNIWGALTLYM